MAADRHVPLTPDDLPDPGTIPMDSEAAALLLRNVAAVDDAEVERVLARMNAAVAEAQTKRDQLGAILEAITASSQILRLLGVLG